MLQSALPRHRCGRHKHERAGQVGCSVAGADIAPVDDRCQPTVGDDHVAGVQVTVKPHTLGCFFDLGRFRKETFEPTEIEVDRLCTCFELGDIRANGATRVRSGSPRNGFRGASVGADVCS